MRKPSLATLRREAARAARSRGHRLRWSVRHGERTSLAVGVCSRCEATVTCNPRPLPNDITIGGDAVALRCGPRHVHTFRLVRPRGSILRCACGDWKFSQYAGPRVTEQKGDA